MYNVHVFHVLMVGLVVMGHRCDGTGHMAHECRAEKGQKYDMVDEDSDKDSRDGRRGKDVSDNRKGN